MCDDSSNVHGRVQPCLVRRYFYFCVCGFASTVPNPRFFYFYQLYFFELSLRGSGCDEMDYSNSCAAHSNGISVSRMGLCSTSTSSTASAATESIASGSTTTAFIATASGTECQIGESADPTMGCTIEGEFCQLEMGVCSDGSGIQYGVCATIPEACTLDYNPVW
jgi:hypothetical protein